MDYRTCTNCLFDSGDGHISFDEHGVCNYCREYIRKEKHRPIEKQQLVKLEKMVTQIKRTSKAKDYDCIVGLSGGLDSSYLLYYARQLGLNPLAVHYDCGWNTEKAVKNIELLLTALSIDLHTYVVDWEEFRDVQLAYLKAGVVDLEIPTDHSFMAALYHVAAKYKIRHILTGHNIVTESVMPHSWVYNKGDATNLRSIHKKYGTIAKLRSFPTLGLWRKFYYYNVLGIENHCPLNYINYNKEAAKAILADAIDWQPHPVKHGESVWTRFYQCYILPNRFGIDKRKAHLSNLICSGQVNKQEAMEELRKPVYDEDLLKTDMEFILKKFDITSAQMEEFMRQPQKKHEDFSTDRRIKTLYNLLQRQFSFTRLRLKISNHW